MVSYRCPKCSTVNSAADERCGTTVECTNPACRQRLEIPKARTKVLMDTACDASTSQATPQPASPPPTAIHAPASAATPHSLPSDVNRYWVRRSGSVYGPYAVEQLRELIQQMRVAATDEVWVPSARAWLFVGSVQELHATPAPAVVSKPDAARKSISPWLWGGGAVGALAVVGVCLTCGVGTLIVVSLRKTPENKQLAQRDSAPVKKDGLDKPPEKKTVSEKKIAPTDDELTPEEIVARRETSVALIKSTFGDLSASGTGFLVRPGILATNCHVIERSQADQLSVLFPSAGEPGKKPIGVARVVFFNRPLDLALIALKDPPPSLPPLPLATNYQFKRAQSILVIGNPGVGGAVPNIENAVSRGITSTELPIDGVPTYQLDISVNPGNSGGPVLDGKGRVIGVVKSRATKQERIGFCLPVRELEAAITKVELASSHELDRQSSRFNARAMLLRILWSAEIFDTGTIQVEKAWENADRNNLPIPPAIADAQAQFKKMLKQVHVGLWDKQDMSDHIARVGVDPLLPEAMRQDFASLWQAHESIRNNYLAPSGALPAYTQSNEKAIGQVRNLVGKLRVSLGMTEQELLLPPS